MLSRKIGCLALSSNDKEKSSLINNHSALSSQHKKSGFKLPFFAAFRKRARKKNFGLGPF